LHVSGASQSATGPRHDVPVLAGLHESVASMQPVMQPPTGQGVPVPAHRPDWHVLFNVQKRPSSHSVPSSSGVITHAPVAGTQRLCTQLVSAPVPQVTIVAGSTSQVCDDRLQRSVPLHRSPSS
jgi:hypothetical protein